MASEQGGDRSRAKARLIDYHGTRPFGVRWRLGDRSGEVSTGTTDRDEAIEFRAVLMHGLRQGKVPSREARGPALAWSEFRRRYEDEALPDLSKGSRSLWRTSANHCEAILNPKLLVDLDKSAFSRLRSKLLETNLSPSSVASYLRTLRAALGWAYDIDLIDSVPKVRARKGLKLSTAMRGRPVNREDFEKILMAVPKVRPKDPEPWAFFLKGLRLSSLRVDEVRRLSWDEWEPLSIDRSGAVPLIRMMAAGHKGRRDLFLPITREFWALIDRRGVSRSGPVFQIPNNRGGLMTTSRIIHVIGDIGKRAGVIVDPVTKRTATSHDIGRRSFLTDLATRRTLSEVQQWARHSDPRTTSQFYVRHQAEELAAAEGWE